LQGNGLYLNKQLDNRPDLQHSPWNRFQKKVRKMTCKPVEEEEHRKKGPRWSWARIQMGNPSQDIGTRKMSL
jgi:hypothetical protein